MSIAHRRAERKGGRGCGELMDGLVGGWMHRYNVSER